VHFLTTPRPPTATLFPYTTLFRSASATAGSIGSDDIEGWSTTARLREFSFSPGTSTQRAMTRMILASRLSSPCLAATWSTSPRRSEEHTSELQSRSDLVCRLLLEK